MASPVFNNNSAQQIPIGTGNFCTIQMPFPQSTTQGAGQNNSPMLEFVSYLFTTGGSATGTITFQELGADGVWRPLVSPAPVVLGAALSYNGSFTGPFHGVRLAAASIAVAPVTYAELKATCRNNG
jgi:hypothetical protein